MTGFNGYIPRLQMGHLITVLTSATLLASCVSTQKLTTFADLEAGSETCYHEGMISPQRYGTTTYWLTELKKYPFYDEDEYARLVHSSREAAEPTRSYCNNVLAQSAQFDIFIERLREDDGESILDDTVVCHSTQMGGFGTTTCY